MEAFEKLKKIIAEAEADVLKFDGGNKAAGTRVRKAMQDVKAAAQEIREKVLENRDVEKPS
ncbi:MAG TPA: histone H1 [Phycisphaerales bacterium]